MDYGEGMKSAFAAFVLVLLAACGRAPQPIPHRVELGPDVAAPDPSVGCNMRVTAPWRAAPGYQVIADAVGVACSDVSLTLTIAGPNGRTHMSASYEVGQLAQLFGGQAQRASLDRDAVAHVLTKWIDPTGPLRHRFVTAKDLPRWEHGEPRPHDPGHAYTPGPTVSRANYAEMRGDRRPLFCYEADAGAVRCNALLSDGAVVLIATARPAR